MSLRNLIDSTSQSFSIKMESLAPQSSYITNGAGFTWGALTFNQWVMGITIVLGALTFAVNSYFQWKRNNREKARERREQELHRKRMESSGDPEPPNNPE